ncbi:hypothetical protein VTK73DRAFT_9035 [Phialemonium thermophilum]|uniref:Maturase K n=1 Tax=Phialemonium thermophilum TaxID=223376 RepID=A0ABR3XN11_9PEZI
MHSRKETRGRSNLVAIVRQRCMSQEYISFLSEFNCPRHFQSEVFLLLHFPKRHSLLRLSESNLTEAVSKRIHPICFLDSPFSFNASDIQ